MAEQATETVSKLKRMDVEAGSWHHVYAPTKGMITAMPSTLLPKEASPYIKGMYLKEGEVISGYGYVPFPTVSDTATNALNGSILRIDQFFKTDGTTFLLCFTSTNTYLYNTTTKTWDVTTMGTEICDCESVWTASSNVTCAADGDIKLRGTYSSSSDISSSFTSGLVSYFDLAAGVDLGSTADLRLRHTELSFWIRSSVSQAAGVFKVRISEQIGASTSDTYGSTTTSFGDAAAGYADNTDTDYTVPALVADTWQHVTVALGDMTAYDAVLSVGLVAASTPAYATYGDDEVEFGGSEASFNAGVVVNIDDIRAIRQWTGDEDNRFIMCVQNDTCNVTNGVDLLQTYDGTGTFEFLAVALAAGSITTSEVLISFKDHMLAMNNTENTADCPQRVSWTNIGTTDDWVNGTAGYQDLVDDESWVIGAGQIGENLVAIYKERSIVGMEWVGGHTPFRFTTKLVGTGLVGKEGFENMGGEHYVAGPDIIYKYTGGAEVETVDDVIHKYLYGRINDEYFHRIMVKYIEEDDELQVWTPHIDENPDEVWCYDVVRKAWWIRDKAMTGMGYYRKQTAVTIGELIGLIGEQNWRFGDLITRANAPITLIGDVDGGVFALDKLSLNNNGVLIHNEFQTPDFVLPDTADYMNKFMRVPQLLFEARGQSVTTEWSDDEGVTWNPTSTPGGNTTSLTSGYDVYQEDFDCTVRKIRFKFTNDLVSSGFYLRYYGIYWIARSGRR